jgi:hypothetical protein
MGLDHQGPEFIRGFDEYIRQLRLKSRVQVKLRLLNQDNVPYWLRLQAICWLLPTSTKAYALLRITIIN